MHESALRTVLLIRSIDEGDHAGEVLSLADRADATQVAAQGAPAIAPGSIGPQLPASAERLLVRRAELLASKLEARSPVSARALEVAEGSSWLGSAVLLLAFTFGVTMSALDGRQRIDILAFPLLSLIVWNLCVYVALLVAWLRPRVGKTRKPLAQSSWLSKIYARVARSRIDTLLRGTSRFNVPLADALQRFASEWGAILQPALLLRAQRLFHLSAVCVALGLVAGLYVRGLVLRYDAGWESTFLDPGQVRSLLGVIYGPAAALSGQSLPSVQDVKALGWREGETGAEAAVWIHWIALTAVLYIVIPRLLAALVVSVQLWRYRRQPALPAGFVPYARSILQAAGRVSSLAGYVVTYAYAPASEALAGLRALLGEALGADVQLESRATVAYGEEDAFVAGLGTAQLPAADCHVLLMSLSATPESENHGVMIEAVQRATARREPGCLLVVDESAYAARMGDDPVLSARRAQRATSWREFAAARNQPICIVELTRRRAGASPDTAVLDHMRKALHVGASS